MGFKKVILWFVVILFFCSGFFIPTKKYREQRRKAKLQKIKEEKQRIEKIVKLRKYCDDYNYVYNLANIMNNKTFSHRYAYVVVKYTYENGIETQRKARQIYRESGYLNWKTSCVGALGASQILPSYWTHLLYVIDKGGLVPTLRKIEKKCDFNQINNRRLYYLLYKKKLSQLEEQELDELRKHKKIYLKKIKKYFYRIGYNIEMGCKIMKCFLNETDNNYVTALNNYNMGPYATNKNGSKKWNYRYINSITNATKLHKELKFYYNWTYIQVKDVNTNNLTITNVYKVISNFIELYTNI